VAHHHLRFLERVLGKVSAEVEAGHDPLGTVAETEAAALRERIKRALPKDR
jgi:hypothetical protein